MEELRYVVRAHGYDLQLLIQLQRLKKIILEDELGICGDLEREMDDLVGTFYDEWKVVVDDPARQKQFRQFVNTVSD